MGAMLDEGGTSRVAAMRSIQSSMQEFSFDAAACRVVQHALSVANRSEAVALASALGGCVHDAVRSENANHVVQKIVQVMPITHVEFLAEELAGTGVEVARNRYGCRVLCRLLEHHAESDAGPTYHLLREVVVGATQLSCHAFAHHVIECAIEHGDERQRHQIASSLRPSILRIAKNRHGSHVVRKALVFCSSDDQRTLVDGMLNNPENILSLVENQNGCFVARAAMRVPSEQTQAAMERLEQAALDNATSKRARRMLNEFRHQFR